MRSCRACEWLGDICPKCEQRAEERATDDWCPADDFDDRELEHYTPEYGAQLTAGGW